MTRKQSKALYLACFPRSECGESEFVEIHEEMERVLAAPDDASAGEVIEWWDCWKPRDTARRAARQIRDKARKMGIA